MRDTWIAFETRYHTNLKTLLNTSSQSVKYIFDNVIHMIRQQTFNNLFQSILLQKIGVVHGAMKINNFQLKNKIFIQDGSYKGLKETGYDNVGVMNFHNGLGFGLDRTYLSSMGEGHTELLDKNAMNLIQQLILPHWENSDEVHGEYNWITDRPKTDRYLPSKTVNKLLALFNWNLNDGQPHIIWSEVNQVFINLDKIIPGDIVGDVFHFIIHWKGKGMLAKSHSRMGPIAMRDIQHCLLCNLLDPTNAFEDIDPSTLPYQYWDANKWMIQNCEHEFNRVIKYIIWLNNETNTECKQMISSYIHNCLYIISIKVFISQSLNQIRRGLVGHFFEKFVNENENWEDSTQDFGGYKIPKRCVGNTIINYLRRFVNLPVDDKLYPYPSAQMFSFALLDILKLSAVDAGTYLSKS